MAKLTLQVLGQTNTPGNGIDAVIAKVKSDLKQIESVPVKITVDASGLEAVDKTALEVLQARAKIETANAKVKASENNLAIAREKTAQSANKRAQEETKLSTQMEKTATAEEQSRIENIRLEQQIEKTNTTQAQAALQAKKTATEEARLATAQQKATAAATTQATAQKTANKEVEKASGLTKLLGGSLDKVVAKIGAWQILNWAVSSLIRSFTDALAVLKEVDSELVTIRKVTGFSDSQISGIREQAFSTASKYGVGAADYLESVAEFSRAGYKEQSAALAELSTKTQIVGDTTAETANQFLLSVDAAYKYKGNIEALTAVLDGANQIDNLYATSIEKIAEGMGIVAPVAAQMHVGVDELSAAIGTITAVTQRTGSEAARALRAIMLNIVGDTKTEIDEGVTWTTGEIAGLRDVIKQYAPEAYEAAKATGAVIDPMEAIGGLAKSMQDGLLTEERLMEMVSDIGGKLRTSQLLALIQNWDMYQSMLTDYADAIGSADKEVENALDSWEKKTNILKNTWAEFISSFVDTEIIKQGIDVLTDLVRGLNSDFGDFVITMGLMIAGFVLLSSTVGFVVTAIGLLVAAIGAAERAQEEEEARLRSTYSELYNLKDAIDEVREAEEALEYAERTNGDEYAEDTLAKETELEEKREALYERRLAAQREYIEKRQELLEKQARMEHLLSKIENTAYAKSGGTDTSDKDYYLKLSEEYTGLRDETAELTKKTNELNATIRETTTILGVDYIHEMDEATRAATELAEATESATESQEKLKLEFKDAVEVYGDVKNALEYVVGALDELDEEGVISFSTMEKLVEIYPELADLATLTADGYIIERAELEALIEAKRAEYELTYNNAVAAAQEQIRALEGESSAWNSTTQSIKDYLLAKAAALRAEASEQGTYKGSKDGNLLPSAMRGLLADSSEQLAAQYEAAAAAIGDAEAQLKNFDTAVGSLYKKTSSTGTSRSSGSSTSSKSTTDEKLQELKDLVSLRESELSLQQASGASENEQIAKMREIQAALHDEAEHLRSIRASKTEINALSTKWWKLQSDILNIQEKMAKTLREKIADAISDITDELEKQRDAALDPLRAELEALKAARDAVEDRREEEERLLAVEKARIALENAQNERTVRQYNAATGQWEWVVNAKDVQSAQSALEEAEKALADYYRDREIATLEANISELDSAYDKLADAIEEFAEAVRNGTASYMDAYEFLISAVEGTGLEALAGSLASGISDGAQNSVIDEMRRNSAAWHGATEEERRALEQANMQLGTAQGWTRGADGVWYDQYGNRVYDSGGILRGLGGIKATREDEMILPPSTTRRLITAEKDGTFDSVIKHLGIVLSPSGPFSSFGGSVSRSTSSQSIDNSINVSIDGMSVGRLSEDTTLRQLAELSRTLALYNN